ncbi:hypothetical protein Pcinc_002563 [Petrolisthes cinctipes]|uniref:Reverse transcriptase domain-containing protein n=1 Tax=Petrolisthes cinctipes TaxID=88211 RepID=A0AAE1L5C2_PETCI|nr:hypothetical protein Pcinc_002563 [Petrolisthes cinctipes]
MMTMMQRRKTEEELRHALSRGRASSPGDDGVTYAVQRLLQQVPGNPLLRLFNLCLRDGCVPRDWTSSTIIPIPKPGTAKSRHISLTSCFCKVMERILLNRLMYRLQDRLSPWLFGFLHQRSTHHCLVDLYSPLNRDSVVAFIDLRSAFDVANRDVILDQLVDFGIKGNLLRWIRGYLSNRTSRVFFSGALSPLCSFYFGMPQGGVLSPLLFNILMHQLLTSLPDISGTTITCYADDICVHSTSPRDLLRFLDSFSVSSHCGIIVSRDKSRIFTCCLPQARPVFTIGGTVIPMCSQYRYLDAPVNIWPIVPARPQDHPIVKDLLGRLQRRLMPLQWLTNNSSGISILVARTIYIAFIRSVVDYLSPALIQLLRATLKTLEKFQNRAMRIILGCPMSTRIVNMQRELRLPPLNIDIMVVDVPSVPPPWMLPTPDASFTPTSKSELPFLQQQLALEHIETVTSSITDPYCLYTDGSLQVDGAAGCAVFSPDMESPPAGWVGLRLCNHSSSTLCELYDVCRSETHIRPNIGFIDHKTSAVK